MFASLILATIGRVDELEYCLRSLAVQTDQDFEVLLIDQNFDNRLDKVIEYGCAVGIEIRHFRMAPPNLSAARNLGLTEARGAIVGFPDDDCWYEPDVIAQLRLAFESEATTSGVVANWAELSKADGVDCGAAVLSNAAWRRFRGGGASSITLFLRRELVNGLEGFDERLGVGQWYGAGEETDLVLRALATNSVIRRLPAARVHHAIDRGRSGDPQSRRCMARARGRGTGCLYAKHDLSMVTILRGLIAPVLVPLVRMRGFDALALGGATAMGRFEGLIHWKWGMRLR